MLKYRIPLILIVLFAAYIYQGYVPYDESEYRDAIQISKDDNYPHEYHEVYSKSGHLLTAIRIQAKNSTMTDPYDQSKGIIKNTQKTQKKPVMFIPGLFCTMNAWMAPQENYKLPFALANQGFDVWVANFRGSVFTQKHKKYTIEDKEFWDYDLNDHATDDLPSLMKYIGEFSNQQIDIISVSLGGSLTYMALAQNEPIVEQYLRKSILLAPGFKAWKVNLVEGIQYLMQPEFKQKYLNTYYFPGSRILNHFGHIFPVLSDTFTTQVSEGIAKYDYASQNNHFAWWPSSGSMKMLEHLVQVKQAKRNQKFDYGKEKNLELYGTEEPEQINLENINKGELHIFYGVHDKIVPIEDHYDFQKEAKNANITIHKFENHAHASFTCPDQENSHIVKTAQILKDDPNYQIIEV